MFIYKFKILYRLADILLHTSWQCYFHVHQKFSLTSENMMLHRRKNTIVAFIIKSNRQPKNLKHILTKAKFEDDTRDEAPKVLKCKNTKCGICENIIEGESFTFKNGPTFKVKTDMSCTSKIYCML